MDQETKPHKILWDQTRDFGFKSLKKEEWAKFTELFNEKPNKGYEFLSSSGLADPNDPAHLAIVFQNCLDLNSQFVGEQLSHYSRIETLKCFLNYYNFEGMDLLSSLREFLASFRLPGEACLIDRLMEAFADRYCACNEDFLKEEKRDSDCSVTDTAYILSFSIIMLNTDQYSPNVKRKMTKIQFVKGNNGVGATEQYLMDLYDSVTQEEIMYGSRGGRNTKPALPQATSKEQQKKKGFLSSLMS